MIKRKTKENVQKILIALLVCLLALGTYFYFLKKPADKSEQNSAPEVLVTPVQEKNPVSPVKTYSSKNSSFATLEINGLKYQAGIVAEENVYDFMDNLRKTGKINFKDKTYAGMGKFVTEINGIAGNGNENWIYYINGVKASIGVSNYKLYSGDVVSWKYEKAY